MFEWLFYHPELYDRQNPQYHDTALKSRLWEEQSSVMEVPTEHLKRWYKSTRTSYARELRYEGDSYRTRTPRMQWLFESFDFIRPHISIRVRSSNRVDPTAEDGDSK